MADGHACRRGQAHLEEAQQGRSRSCKTRERADGTRHGVGQHQARANHVDDRGRQDAGDIGAGDPYDGDQRQEIENGAPDALRQREPLPTAQVGRGG